MRVFDPRGNTDIAVTLKIFVAQLELPPLGALRPPTPKGQGPLALPRGRSVHKRREERRGGKRVAPKSSVIDNAHEREIEARYLELFDRV